MEDAGIIARDINTKFPGGEIHKTYRCSKRNLSIHGQNDKI